MAHWGGSIQTRGVHFPVMPTETSNTQVHCAVLLLHVHRGDVKGHAFQPQHHKQTLRKRTVANALTIAPGLEK